MASEPKPEILAALRQAEITAGNDVEAIRTLEASYEHLAHVLLGSTDFLVQRNRFRLRFGPMMAIRRPKVLYSVAKVERPNFQLRPLLAIADVVCLSLYGDTGEIDVVYLRPQDLIPEALPKLPPGFRPDFYFDYQVEYNEIIPRGLELLPFPTVAGLCHHYEAVKVELIAQLYDFCLPISRRFAELLGSIIDKNKIISIPFGLSWGSFHDIVDAQPSSERDIDVLLSFNNVEPPAYGVSRQNLVAQFERARERFGERFVFSAISGVSRQEYLNELRRSKIVLNCVGINGPYNYRTCEAVNAGALLMQPATIWITGPQYVDEYLEPNAEIIIFDDQSFESNLVEILENDHRRIQIASAAQRRVKQDYSYEALFRKLFVSLSNVDMKGVYARRLNPTVAALARACVYVREAQNLSKIMATYELSAISTFDESLAKAMLLPLRGIIHSVQGAKRASNVGLTGETGDDLLPPYEALLEDLPNPSLVDRWNCLILGAEEGRFNSSAAHDLITALQQPGLLLDEVATLRIYEHPNIEGVPDKFVAELAYRIRNIGHLVAAGDKRRRSDAARDFMLAWLYALLASSGAEEDMLQRCGTLIEGYDTQKPSPWTPGPE